MGVPLCSKRSRELGGGYRAYDESDLRLLRQIRTLQDFGFGLEETGPFVECLRAGHPEGDSNPATTHAYKVLSMPTFMVFPGGEPVKAMVGARAARRKLLGELADVIWAPRRDNRKSPEQLRSGDFLAYICLFVTSSRLKPQ